MRVVEVRKRGRAARPEDLAEDGGCLQQALLVRRQPVEACGDDPLNCLRQRQILRRSALDVQARELLRVQRISTGALEQRRLRVRGQENLLEDVRKDLRGFVVRERRQRDRARVQLAAAPAGTPIEQLRARGAEHEQGDSGRPLDELVDEVEQAVVGPVQILEDEHERMLLGEALEVGSPSGERLALLIAALVLAADQWQERLHHPGAFCVVDTREALPQLPARDVEGVVLLNPGLRLHHLSDRPEAHALAVRERASLTPPDEVRCLADALEELGDEPRLADPGHPDERDELRLERFTGPLERGEDRRELARSPDERQRRALLEIHPEARLGLDSLPDEQGLCLALRDDGRAFLVVDHVPRRAIGRLADEHAVHGSRGLQAGSRVDDVPRRHPLSLRRACAEQNERLAGVDGDPHLDVSLLACPVTNRERGANRALRIVLVRDRGAEERHHGVADELLDGAAVALELAAQTLPVRCEHGTHIFGVELFRPRREPDEVGEEHGDDLPLLAALG